MSKNPVTIGIVGAGVVGLLTAYYLKKKLSSLIKLLPEQSFVIILFEATSSVGHGSSGQAAALLSRHCCDGTIGEELFQHTFDLHVEIAAEAQESAPSSTHNLNHEHPYDFRTPVSIFQWPAEAEQTDDHEMKQPQPLPPSQDEEQTIQSSPSLSQYSINTILPPISIELKRSEILQLSRLPPMSDSRYHTKAALITPRKFLSYLLNFLQLPAAADSMKILTQNDNKNEIKDSDNTRDNESDVSTTATEGLGGSHGSVRSRGQNTKNTVTEESSAEQFITQSLSSSSSNVRIEIRYNCCIEGIQRVVEEETNLTTLVLQLHEKKRERDSSDQKQKNAQCSNIDAEQEEKIITVDKLVIASGAWTAPLIRNLQQNLLTSQQFSDAFTTLQQKVHWLTFTPPSSEQFSPPKNMFDPFTCFPCNKTLFYENVDDEEKGQDFYTRPGGVVYTSGQVEPSSLITTTKAGNENLNYFDHIGKVSSSNFSSYLNLLPIENVDMDMDMGAGLDVSSGMQVSHDSHSPSDARHHQSRDQPPHDQSHASSAPRDNPLSEIKTTCTSASDYESNLSDKIQYEAKLKSIAKSYNYEIHDFGCGYLPYCGYDCLPCLGPIPPYDQSEQPIPRDHHDHSTLSRNSSRDIKTKTKSSYTYTYKDLYINNGQGVWGITAAPASGHVLASQIVRDLVIELKSLLVNNDDSEKDFNMLLEEICTENSRTILEKLSPLRFLSDPGSNDLDF